MKTRNNNNCSLKYINKFKNHCKNQIKKKEKKRKIEISLPPTIFNFQNPTKLNKNSLEQFPRKLNPFARSSTYPPIDLQTFEPAKKTPWSSSFVNRRRHFPILFYSLLKHRSWNTVKRNPCVLWTRFPFRAHPRVHARYVAEGNRGGWYRPFPLFLLRKSFTSRHSLCDSEQQPCDHFHLLLLSLVFFLPFFLTLRPRDSFPRGVCESSVTD